MGKYSVVTVGAAVIAQGDILFQATCHWLILSLLCADWLRGERSASSKSADRPSCASEERVYRAEHHLSGAVDWIIISAFFVFLNAKVSVLTHR